jgi:ABC-2 type transport system permease protein
MKQFSTILKFELMGYLKNKVFVGLTVFLLVLVTAVMVAPNVLSAVSAGSGSSGDDPASRPALAVYAEDEALASLAERYFTEAFPTYRITRTEESVDALKDRIVAGDLAGAFVLDSASSYTYYVNNLSMYDTNAKTAGEVLQNVYRINAMISGGISPENAGDILSVSVTGKTETLGKDQMQNFFYTYIMIFALYMVIMLYGQMVSTNVATEKSSRAMEVLITSAHPNAMMFGKVFASCIAGLSQLVLIFGTSILMYHFNRNAWSDSPIISAIFGMPLSLFFYMLVFFVLGFLIYAFLYGAIGSTVSKLEDINTSAMPITFLFMIAFFVVIFSMTSGSVDNIAMRVCSFIPFTSPVAMFTRIAMGTVELYEIVISIVLLVLSTLGIGALSAKIYRVGVLLYGTPPKLSAIIKTVLKQ